MRYKVGDKIVCINNRPHHPDLASLNMSELLTIDKIYVVERINDMGQIIITSDEGTEAWFMHYDEYFIPYHEYVFKNNLNKMVNE